MSMDDLLKGLSVFTQGMQQYQTAQAVNDANEQMLALNTAAVDKNQKLAAQNEISGTLAMRLAASGQDAAKISALTDSIGPSRGAQYQADQNMQLQSNTQAFTGQQNALERANKIQIEQMKLDAAKANAGKKLTKDEVAFVSGHQKAFDSQAKKSMDALNQLQVVKASLASNNPIADKSTVNFLARASGEVGALTEADKKPFGGSTAYAAQAAQFAENAKTGKFTPENKKFVTQLVDTYEKAQTKNIMGIRDRIAQRATKQASLAGYNLDQPKISEMIFPTPAQQISDKQKEQQAKQATIQAAKQWLASDAAKQNPAKAAKVLKQVNAMENGL